LILPNNQVLLPKKLFFRQQIKLINATFYKKKLDEQKRIFKEK